MNREVSTRHIRSLKPNVTREEAIRYFTAGVANRAASLLRGPVRSLADLYIPFRCFQVKIRSAGRQQEQSFALDAVRGVLDLYRLPPLSDHEQVITLQSRNVLPTMVDPSQSAALLIEKVRRMVFARGFFRVRDLNIEAVPLLGEICVPYWVCFRGTTEQVHLAVLDAVRRRPEGAKVRRLVEEWLRSDPGNRALESP
jgi:hypothetical protein